MRKGLLFPSLLFLWEKEGDVLIENDFNYSAELVKAYQDGDDWIIEGIASTPEKDFDGESLVQKGLDFKTYFLNNGFIKWEHTGKDGVPLPSQYIGEPLDAEIRPEGFWIKGRLYSDMPLAKDVVDALKGLEKSKANRKLKFSVEGKVLERAKDNPKKILKALIRNVALTFNPINNTTWAQLVKSMSTGSPGSESVGADGSALRSESLEKDVIKLFKEFVKDLLKDDKLLPKEWAVKKGIVNNELVEFLNKNYPLIQICLSKAGGDSSIMANLEKALNDSMDELLKAADVVQEEEEIIIDEDELMKALKDDEDDEDEEKIEKEEKKEEKKEEEEDDDDEDDEEEEDAEKSFYNQLREDEEIETAMEVSDFLDSLVKSIGKHLDGIDGKISKAQNFDTVMAKSFLNLGKVVGAISEKVTSMEKQIETIATSPVGRKGVVSQKEIETITKGSTNEGVNITRGDVVEYLVKGVEAGELSPIEVTKYETTSQLSPTAVNYLKKAIKG